MRFYAGAESNTQTAFATGTHAFSDRWTVAGGLRHTADDKSQKRGEGGGFALLEIGSILGVFLPYGGVRNTRPQRVHSNTEMSLNEGVRESCGLVGIVCLG